MFSAGALPFKTTRYSLFAIRYSPFATRCRFRLGRNFALPFFSGYATFENLPKFLPAEEGEGDALLSVGTFGVDGIVGNRSRSGGLVITR
jgi:hypothetical protein